ncbi:MAG: oxygenase MpaB family protein, partial [Saprospiraceae bacterium]
MQNSTNLWNGLDLNNFRQIMDPPSDEAVKSLYESIQFKTDRNELKAMAQNDSFVPADLPEDLRCFVENELFKKFTPEDIRKFEMTRDIWKENGVQFIFVLFFRALPYTYMAEKPANVLRLTKLLEDQPMRRVFETAQFIFDIMDQNWWDPTHRGILTALKVRIMHSAMRYNLLNKPEGEPWNKEAWGMPISQEDLVATNQCFSLEFFKGLEMLGQP